MRSRNLLRRAATMGAQEWSTRVVQLGFHARNGMLAALGWQALPQVGHLRSLGLDPSALAPWWKKRGARWFVDSARRDKIQAYYSRCEEERARILERSDRVLSGKMPLFSFPPIDFTASGRWRRDPIHGVVAPQRFYGKVRYLEAEEVGDSKLVWEPNRFPWVYWLGAAHVITGRDVYADKFAALTHDWFEENPYPMGINYCSSLEVALRCYAWVWALDLYAVRLGQDGELLNRILHGIWLGCRHVEKTLSYYFAPNTHLLGEAFALYACGSALPEFREAPRWRHLGENILAREARRQIHADGTHRELSTCYHLYTTDFYVQAAWIARHCGQSVDPAIAAAAQLLAQRLAALCPDGGVLPQFNDCDGGRLTWFSLHALDATPALRSAAALVGAPGPAATRDAARGYDLWMSADLEGARTAPNLPAASGGWETRSGGDSGLVTHRNAAGDYVLFRSGPFGYMDCGHSHDAQTGIIVYLGGRPVLVDSGTGTYTSSLESRDRFRGAVGKNVLLVDGRGPSEPGSWFGWERKTQAVLACARRFDGGFLCAGSHEGYTALAGFSVQVRRSVVLFDDGIVVVLDYCTAARPVARSLILTFHPDLQVDLELRRLRAPEGVTYYMLAHTLVSEGAAGLEPVANEDDASPAAQPVLAGGIGMCLTTSPYSSNYGHLGTTAAVVIDYGRGRDGAWATVLSRQPVAWEDVQERFQRNEALAGLLAPAPPQGVAKSALRQAS